MSPLLPTALLFHRHPPSARAARKASDQDKLELIKKVKCFIFDCDGGPAAGHCWVKGRRAALILTGCLAGVIWRGDSVIEGVSETLDLLRSLVGAARMVHGRMHA